MTTVLCIQNHEGSANLVIDLLAYANGYEGLIAVDGQMGYEMVLAHQPDLIITETWNLSRKDGISLVRELLGTPSFRRVPILLLTVPPSGLYEDELRTAFMNLPYCVKPLNTREFARLIACLLEWAAERVASAGPTTDPASYPFFVSREEPLYLPHLCQRRWGA